MTPAWYVETSDRVFGPFVQRLTADAWAMMRGGRVRRRWM